MSIAADLKILSVLVLRPIRGDTHAQRLEIFYISQAAGYDEFRKKLLLGREELLAAVSSAGGFWLDCGCGTGESLQVMSHEEARFERIGLVDLSPSLLDIARKRKTRFASDAVTILQADVTTVAFDAHRPNLITFSYSLAMMPEWYRALENAYNLLAPGGKIAVVDFYISAKFPAAQRAYHGWLQRTITPIYFASSSVFLNPDHLGGLESYFEALTIMELTTTLPYLPGIRAPYYLFIGEKR